MKDTKREIMTVALPLSHTHTYSHVKRADNPQLLVSDMQERKKTIKTNINKHHKYQISRREYDCLNAASSGSSCGIYTENTSATGQTPNPRPYKHSLHLFLHKQDAGSLSYQHQVSRLLRLFSCSQEEAPIMWPQVWVQHFGPDWHMSAPGWIWNHSKHVRPSEDESSTPIQWKVHSDWT